MIIRYAVAELGFGAGARAGAGAGVEVLLDPGRYG